MSESPGSAHEALTAASEYMFAASKRKHGAKNHQKIDAERRFASARSGPTTSCVGGAAFRGTS